MGHVRAVKPGRSVSALLGIGEVLELLSTDFQELSHSKIRFLEEQGLVTPSRTASGYRKFSQKDVERLRIVLTLQRDYYLPHKVIAKFLEELDEGGNPAIPGNHGRDAESILRPNVVLTTQELCKRAGATRKFLGEAIAAGLIQACEVYPQDALAQLCALVKLAERGIHPRLLTQLRVQAERDVKLLERAGAARGLDARSPAGVELSLELAEHLDTVRSGILRRHLQGG